MHKSLSFIQCLAKGSKWLLAPYWHHLAARPGGKRSVHAMLAAHLRWGRSYRLLAPEPVTRGDMAVESEGDADLQLGCRPYGL